MEDGGRKIDFHSSSSSSPPPLLSPERLPKAFWINGYVSAAHSSGSRRHPKTQCLTRPLPDLDIYLPETSDRPLSTFRDRQNNFICTSGRIAGGSARTLVRCRQLGPESYREVNLTANRPALGCYVVNLGYYLLPDILYCGVRAHLSDGFKTVHNNLRDQCPPGPTLFSPIKEFTLWVHLE